MHCFSWPSCINCTVVYGVFSRDLISCVALQCRHTSTALFANGLFLVNITCPKQQMVTCFEGDVLHLLTLKLCCISFNIALLIEFSPGNFKLHHHRHSYKQPGNEQPIPSNQIKFKVCFTLYACCSILLDLLLLCILLVKHAFLVSLSHIYLIKIKIRLIV